MSKTPLFKNGNSKLGKGILTFSIPAGATCPGKSDLCASACYAGKGAFSWGNVQQSMQLAYMRTQSPKFAEMCIDELGRKRKASVVRVHVAGDLYSVEYASKWLEIMQNARAKDGKLYKYFLFTRSWRLDGFEPVLRAMHDLPNVELFASLDDEMREKYIDRLPSWMRQADIVDTFNDMDKTGAHKGYIACLNQKKKAKLVTDGMGKAEASEATYSCMDCTYCFSPDTKADGSLKRNRHVAFAKH